MADTPKTKVKDFYVDLAGAFHKSAKDNPAIAAVTDLRQTGERTPKAKFTVIANAGDILEVTVKRVTAA